MKVWEGEWLPLTPKGEYRTQYFLIWIVNSVIQK